MGCYILLTLLRKQPDRTNIGKSTDLLKYDGIALGCHFANLSVHAIRSGKRLVSTFNSDPFTEDVIKVREPVTRSQDDAAQAPTASGTATANQNGTSVVPSKAPQRRLQPFGQVRVSLALL